MFCKGCGYSLRELKEPRCSECGKAFDPYDSRTWRRTPHSLTQRLINFVRLAAAGLLIVASIFGLVVTFAFEFMLAISEHPLYLPCVVLIGGSTAALVGFLGRSRFAAMPVALLAIVAALFSFVAVSPVKPFAQAQKAIQVGMTPDEVRRVVATHFPEDARFRRPVECQYAGYGPSEAKSLESSSLCFVLDPDGWGAALLVINFEHGRAVEATYYPD